MIVGDVLEIENMILGSSWNLKVPVNGYESSFGKNLVTQVQFGRNFKIINLTHIENKAFIKSQRIMVRLLEDGYECWFSLDDVIGKASLIKSWVPTLFSKKEIIERIPKVLSWVKDAYKIPNKYLWGGTIGPDYDCSGFVQAAFSSEGIWLPRDAYQQEDFCEKIYLNFNNFRFVNPGDLLFFGNKESCTHVAIYLYQGKYIHSSGISNGLNGIGISSIYENEPISSYYRSRLRSVGRVCRCYDG